MRSLDLVAALRERAESHPDLALYNFLPRGEEVTATLTPERLDQRARELGAWLQGRFVPGDRLVLLFAPGLEFIQAFFGALYGGVLPVPVYPPQTPAEVRGVQRLAADAGASAVLTEIGMSRALADGLGAPLDTVFGRSVLTIDGPIDGRDATEGPLAAAEDWRDPGLSGDSLAFLQYTSGSTGDPKGVMVRHAGLLSTCTDIDRAFQHGPESVMVSWLPTFHDMGLIYGALLPMLVGFPCYLMPPTAFLRRPIRWLRTLSAHGGSHSAAPNFAYDLCVRKTRPEEREGLDLSAWRVASNGAEPIREATLRAFFAAFQPHGFRWRAFSPSYGLAEATLKVTTTRADEPLQAVDLDRAALEEGKVVEVGEGVEGVSRHVGCGRSDIGAEILIVDPETLEPCPPDRVGEIWVASASVAAGYWNRPEPTKQVFEAFTRPDAVGEGGRGPFLRTGDLGFFRHGELFVTGRLKDLIIRRGRNYYPQDIERVVEAAHPALRPGCGAAFALGGSAGEGLVVMQEIRVAREADAGAAPPGRSREGEEALQAIRRGLAREIRLSPDHILVLPPGTVPKTSSGKVRRAASRTLFERDAAGEAALPVVARWPEAER